MPPFSAQGDDVIAGAAKQSQPTTDDRDCFVAFGPSQ
jgi:hypothetical protein